MHSHYACRFLHPTAAPVSLELLDNTLSISFAVAICTFLAYLIVISIIRACQEHHPGGPTHPQHPDHPHNAPPDPECLAQLCIMHIQLYHLPLKPKAASAADITPEESCSVCLGDYEEEEEVRVLPRCRHLFHRACIDQWLLSRSSFCPVCRDRVIEQEVEQMTTSCMRNSNTAPIVMVS